MDATTHYRIVFSGYLRQGFTAEAVRQALAQRMGLQPAQLERLFSGRPQVLKRTDSHEEAKRTVLLLAGLGAIATIDQEETPAAPADEPAAEAAPPARAEPVLPKFSPARKNLLFTPLLYLAAATEVASFALYLLLLLVLPLLLVGQVLFSTWAAALIGFAPLALLLQLLLFVAGGVALLLLAKPLLSLRHEGHAGIELTPRQEPDLFLFVADVCERVKAPMPHAIWVNNDIALRIDYRGGIKGFLRNDTQLTLGAPLIAACDASQLAALTAQALLGFHGGAAPRAAYLLRLFYDWLQRAIFGRDRLDLALQAWAEEGRLPEPLLRLGINLIALSRRLLGVRLQLTKRLTRRLMHRLVADADKVVLVFAGSAEFVRLLDQVSLLTFAARSLIPTLQEQWQSQGELPDNLVQAMVLRSRQYPADMPQQLRTLQEREIAASQGLLPSDSQRILRVSRQRVAGSYGCQSPAATLLRNYTKLAHIMTLRFYHNRLTLPVTPDRLRETAPAGKAEQAVTLHLKQLFNGFHADLIPLKLGHTLRLAASGDQARAQWQAAMTQLQEGRSRTAMAHQQYLEALRELIDNSCLEVIHRAGLARQWGGVRLTGEEEEQLHTTCRISETSFEETALRLAQQMKPYTQRLTAALALAADTATLREEIEQLVATSERIEQIIPQLRSLRLYTLQLQLLLSYDGHRGKDPLHDLIHEQASDVRQLVNGIGASLKTTPYPFNDSYPTLLDFVQRNAYSDEGAYGDFDRGNDTLTELLRLQRHILARLGAIARHVEKRLGL